MTQIDPKRRAEIGRGRSERTRALLIASGRKVLSKMPMGQVSVQSVTKAAGVAQGTFYYHFEHLDDLFSVISEELFKEFVEFIGPQRTYFQKPIERMTAAVLACYGKAVSDRAWARLVSNAKFLRTDQVSPVVRADFEGAWRDGFIRGLSSNSAIRIGMAMTLEFLAMLDDPDCPTPEEMQASLLRALGVSNTEAQAIIEHVKKELLLVGLSSQPKKRKKA